MPNPALNPDAQSGAPASLVRRIPGVTRLREDRRQEGWKDGAISRASLGLGLIALVACTSFAGVSKVRYSPLVTTDRPLRSVEQVEVFLTQKPSRPYQEIGILTYRAGTAEQYVNVVQYMRQKAAQIGADGIVMMDSHAGPSIPLGYVIATLTDYRAMAIVYED